MNKIEEAIYAELMSHNYMVYAKAVLTERALPDVRDGLLPVQRRVMLAMHEANLNPSRPRDKCASIVGDTMGKFHPHGDSSIYGALVRMAQDFSLRAPLVDGKGNFGSIHGSPPAAMRYTEAKMTALGQSLFGKDLHQEILPNDYGRSYDGKHVEPNVLPAAFPNLLVNGNIGIGVGMTASFLPHNPSEVLDLCLWRLANPTATPAQVVKRIQGPDFPTSSLIVQNAGLKEAYLTGKGKIISIGQMHVEPLAGNREKIVITSIPWNTKVSSIVEKIKDEGNNGTRLPEVVEIQDFTGDKDDIKIEIFLKWGSDASDVIKKLYSITDLRKTYSVAMNALVDGKPQTLGLTEILDHFLDFRRYIIIKRYEKRVREIERRLHQLEALIKALDVIDAVVALIKKSKDKETARNGLKKLLKIDDQQATWILAMQLSSLTQLDQFELKQEVKELKTEMTTAKKIIKTPVLVTEIIADETRELKKSFASSRMSKFIKESDVGTSTGPISVPAENCVLAVSQDGYITTVSGTLKRGSPLSLSAKDRLVVFEPAKTDEEWVVFSASGKAFRLRLADVGLESKKSKGVNLSQLVGLEAGDSIAAAHKIPQDDKGTLLFVYASGMVKRTAWSEFKTAHTAGIVAAKPNAGDKVIGVAPCEDNEFVVLLGTNGKGIRFAASAARPIGRNSAGVRGINLGPSETLIGWTVANEKDQLLLVTNKGFAKRLTYTDFAAQGRGGGGVALAKAKDGRYGEVEFIANVQDKSILHLEYANGLIKPIPANKAAKVSRTMAPKRFAPGDGAYGVFVKAE